MENNEKKEIVYTKAKLGKRLFAHFYDLGILFLSTAILFSIINMAITNSSWYKDKSDALVAMRNDSHLYEDGVEITTVVKNDGSYPSYENKKDYLSTHIDYFYHNTTYFKDLTAWNEYGQRKLEAKTGDTPLFIKEGENIIENNVSHEELYNFYVNEINNYCLGFLTVNPDYFNLTRFSFWTIVIEIIVILTLMFTLFYLIFPLFIFKRGRQTIGMKLEKIALINIRAVNVTVGVYILRFFFMYGVFLILDFVGFLIPAFVSIGMMYGSKSNSSLANYVFNDYMVDISSQDIYLDEGERDYKAEELKKFSIENRDLTLK